MGGSRILLASPKPPPLRPHREGAVGRRAAEQRSRPARAPRHRRVQRGCHRQHRLRGTGAGGRRERQKGDLAALRPGRSVGWRASRARGRAPRPAQAGRLESGGHGAGRYDLPSPVAPVRGVPRRRGMSGAGVGHPGAPTSGEAARARQESDIWCARGTTRRGVLPDEASEGWTSGRALGVPVDADGRWRSAGRVPRGRPRLGGGAPVRGGRVEAATTGEACVQSSEGGLSASAGRRCVGRAARSPRGRDPAVPR